MIEVARAVAQLGMLSVFQVHDSGYDHLVDEAGFRRLPGARPFTAKQASKAIAFDHSRSLSHPFTKEVLRERVAKEREAIRSLRAVAVVHGTNPTSPISTRAEQVPLVYPVPYVFSQAHLVSQQPLPFVPNRGVGQFLNRLLRGPVLKAMQSQRLLPSSFRMVAQENGVTLQGLLDIVHVDFTLLTCLQEELKGVALPPGTVRVGPIFAHLESKVT